MTPPRRAARVRVESGPHGRELIVDETFASLHRADGPATGCVWDAIAAPALLLAGRRPRVLVLGLGGGSAARIVRALIPDAELVGVEIDADVVAAAREHFELDSLGITLHVDDALRFLERDRRRYDLILEDVFIGRGDAVHKPDWIPHPAHDLARRSLRGAGLLVSNTIDEAGEISASLGASFRSLLRIDVEDYDNRILVASDAPIDARTLRARVAASSVLHASLPLLRFRTVQRPPAGPARSAGTPATRRGTARPRR
jgi:spermidine synthase